MPSGRLYLASTINTLTVDCTAVNERMYSSFPTLRGCDLQNDAAADLTVIVPLFVTAIAVPEYCGPSKKDPGLSHNGHSATRVGSSSTSVNCEPVAEIAVICRSVGSSLSILVCKRPAGGD